MHKIIRTILVMAMAMCLMVVPAFAAESTSSNSTVYAKDASGAAVELSVTAASTSLTVDKAAEVIGSDVKAADLSIQFLNDIEAKTETSGSLTLTFNVAGASASQTMYVLHYVDGAWKLEGKGPCPSISVTVDSTSPFAVLITKAPAATAPAGNGTTSDKTGNGIATMTMLAVALIAGTAAVIIRKKVTA